MALEMAEDSSTCSVIARTTESESQLSPGR